MAQGTIANLESLLSVRGKLNDNFTELYKNTVTATATAVTISAGSATIAQMVHTITSESGTSDNLDTLTKTSLTAEQLLFVRPTSGHTITVTNDGNIITPTGENYEIPANGMMLMQYDGTKWRMTGGSSFPIANDTYITWVDSAGDPMGVMKLNSSNEIDLGAQLNAGPIELETNSGAVTIINLPVDATPADGDEESMSFSIDSNPVFKVKGSADGTGGADSFQCQSFGSWVRNTTTVNAATYDLLTTDDILLVTYTSTAAVTSLTLPTAQTVNGRTIVIKDAGGNAGVNNITIDSVDNIDGAGTLVLSTNYDSVTLVSNGSTWFTI